MSLSRRDVLRGGVVGAAMLPLSSLMEGTATAVSQPWIGEIMIFAGNFAPAGWALCNGQLVPISENDALFTLIGTTYGGDGQETFALPNLQSRVPVHVGTGFTLGQMAGVESVTLTTNQIPVHTHVPLAVSGSPSQSSPVGATWATSGSGKTYAAAANNTMAAGLIGPTGGSQPHDNMIPYLTLTWCISLFGIFPNFS